MNRHTLWILASVALALGTGCKATSDTDDLTETGDDDDIIGDDDDDDDGDDDDDDDTTIDEGPWISGYYVGYQRGLYPPEEVDFEAMTHVVVGRITPNQDGSLTTNFDIDDVNGPAMAIDMSDRAHSAGIKAILMVGGAGENDWSSAASDNNRAAFVGNLIDVMDEYDYDGLDIDWEPIAEVDYPNVLALAEDLRAARPGIILTIPLGWINGNWGTVDPFYATIEPQFDQINLMTYAMAGEWQGWQSWHGSALTGHTATTPSSIESSIDGYLDAGIPAAKLGIGLGFFGGCWVGVDGPLQDGGSHTANDNTMSYTNIMADYYAAEDVVWDSSAQVPYLSFDAPVGPQGCTFVTYDDPESIAAKGEYVLDAGLGGAIIWTINQGYIADNAPGNRNPLLEATAASMRGE